MSAGSLRFSGGENGVLSAEVPGRAEAEEPGARMSRALKPILPLAGARGAGWVPLLPLHLARV